MNILVFNCGSSSLKYRLIAMPAEQELSGGEAQRIGPPTAKPSCLVLQPRRRGQGDSRAADAGPCGGPAGSRRPAACDARRHAGRDRPSPGQRGAVHTDYSLVDDTVLAELLAHQDLAPIHNPPAIATIQACRRSFPACRRS